jgi:hypothetical protein
MSLWIALCLVALCLAAPTRGPDRRRPQPAEPRPEAAEPRDDAEPESPPDADPPISEGLTSVAEGMRESSNKLKTGELTDKLLKRQRAVAEEIARLIARTSDESGGGNGGKQPKPKDSTSQDQSKQPKPRQTPRDSSGQGGGSSGEDGDAPVGTVDPETVQWGDLPPRERDRIFQSMRGRFPPKYRRLLESYYREMAK